MFDRTRFSAALASASLLPLLLAGCAGGPTRGPSGSPLPDLVSGNWQISSSTPAAVHLPAISGTLAGSSAAITGVLHTQTASACTNPSNSFEVSGAADKNGNVTLSGSLAGGQLTVTGSLAADGKSLEEATYTVAGGTCALATSVKATAAVYSSLNGTYAGNFSDSDGQVATVQATFSQSSPNANGDYTITGSATPVNNPCFTGTVPLTNTLVTGNTFTFTYTDPASSNSVTATGTFSADASSLSVGSWTSSGSCGPDAGTGTLTKQ
ncbi:MAG: hypothetical protein ACRYFU_14310 [Janthinobacterium lividum]